MSSPASPPPNPSLERSRKKILDAAVTCFNQGDGANTTMEEIARVAGVGRKTVYRAFPNRNALIDSLAIERINLWRDRIKDVVDTCASFEDAVVSGILEALHCFRQDPVVMAAIAATHDNGVERYLISPDSPMQEKMRFAWQGVFNRARKSGELRADLSDETVSSWLLGIHLVLLLRDDMDTAGQRDWIEKLVMPGLRPPVKPTSRKKA